jgi:hypothetical protein
MSATEPEVRVLIHLSPHDGAVETLTPARTWFCPSVVSLTLPLCVKQAIIFRSVLFKCMNRGMAQTYERTFICNC